MRSSNPPTCFAIASAQAPPVAGDGAFASFRSVAARAVLSARVPRAGSFRPTSSFLARLYLNPLSAVLLPSSGFVARCPGWSTQPVHRTGFSNSNSVCRAGPFLLELAARCSVLPSGPRPSCCFPFPNPHPLRNFVCPSLLPVELAEPHPSPGFVRLDCGADRADGFLSNIECAVQREFAQNILLNRIGLGKGPFPLAVRGDSGSGVFEADRVVDLLRAERDHADPK